MKPFKVCLNMNDYMIEFSENIKTRKFNEVALKLQRLMKNNRKVQCGDILFIYESLFNWQLLAQKLGMCQEEIIHIKYFVMRERVPIKEAAKRSLLMWLMECNVYGAQSGKPCVTIDVLVSVLYDLEEWKAIMCLPESPQGPDWEILQSFSLFSEVWDYF